MMKRIGLTYLAGYLIGGGLALVFSPTFALKLLGSTGEYGTALPRLTGIVMVALGWLVAMVVKKRVEPLYVHTVLARLGILGVLGWLYGTTRDPLFLVLTFVVGLGVIVTTIGLFLSPSNAANFQSSSA
jgi:hypothetical protein